MACIISKNYLFRFSLNKFLQTKQNQKCRSKLIQWRKGIVSSILRLNLIYNFFRINISKKWPEGTMPLCAYIGKWAENWQQPRPWKTIRIHHWQRRSYQRMGRGCGQGYTWIFGYAKIKVNFGRCLLGNALNWQSARILDMELKEFQGPWVIFLNQY